jgi:hypothetical protein
LNSGSIEIGCGGDAPPIDEGEIARECLDCSFYAIAALASQLNEIVRPGKGDQETPVAAEDSPKFACIHSRGDGEDDGERSIGIRHEAIGIGHNPLAARIAARRGIDCRNGDVDAMRIEAKLAGKGTEVEAVATAGIEDNVALRRGHDIRDGMKQGLGHAEIVQSPSSLDGSLSVARLLGSPILRLEQVDVSATRDVERMSARTNDTPLLAQQRLVAVSDGA